VTYKKAILKWIASCEFKTVTVNKNMLLFFAAYIMLQSETAYKQDIFSDYTIFVNYNDEIIVRENRRMDKNYDKKISYKITIFELLSNCPQ
jgi:hypothetical protein